jgi:hypothetical protein
MTGYGYRGYGLSLASDIELPEYQPIKVDGQPDIRVRIDGEAMAAWEASDMIAGVFNPSRHGGHVLRIAQVAVFHVRGGAEIRIAAEPGADSGLVRLYTIGSAMGMTLHQRGVLVLHGATIARDGLARIIVGGSGAGKSTLAALLGQAGCAVLGDDTIAIWDAPDGAGKRLWQGSRVFKLWEESLDAMGIAADGLTPLGNRVRKFFVPNPGPSSDTEAELAEILLLEVHDEAARIEPVTGLHAVKAIADNTYRPEYVGLLGSEEQHFRQCADLARQVRVSRLLRPWDLARSGETVSAVLDLWDPARANRGAG